MRQCLRFLHLHRVHPRALITAVLNPFSWMHDGLNPSSLFSTGPPVLSPDGDGLKEEQPEEGMGCLLPSEMVLAVDKSPFDSKSSPLKQQVSKDLQKCKTLVEFRGRSQDMMMS